MGKDIVLRKPTKKYYFMHDNYLKRDRDSVMPIVEAFARDLSIPYESIKISRKGRLVSYRTASSEKGEGDAFAYLVPLFVTFNYYRKYHGQITYKEEQS